MKWNGILEEYKDLLNLEFDQFVSLSEGNTPLVKAEKLSIELGSDVYLKIEGANPTGSFKDRGMTAAVSAAKFKGVKNIVCASTGNTSASAAAYAVRAAMGCLVIIPEGKVAFGKLSQALIFGAKVIQVKGNFDDALNIVRQLGQENEFEIVNSINPYRLIGQQTGAFEVVEQLGRAPDYQYMPVGNAGNITAYWRGYKKLKTRELVNTTPVMRGIQASGAAPFLRGAPVKNPDTIATAIRIGNPASWDGAQEAVSESFGGFSEVADSDILNAYRRVAANEGIFCEPASAASIAGLVASPPPKGSLVVAILTGNGLKDPDTAINQSEILEPVEADYKSVKEVIRNLG